MNAYLFQISVGRDLGLIKLKPTADAMGFLRETSELDRKNLS